ncbi:zinc finger MYM-type protein 1 [Capsella rubella]|uniref:zinc finger MYM-type protein 1 n=1 Tax=Capsella rubella TaxID=81985 RepID=UPI000CD4E894|nr:zinc finger MYM-type protein 1 [Capsella rubella]
MDRFVTRDTPLSNIDLDDLPWDPAKRKNILSYHPNQRDEVRRKYLSRGPCQPRGHNFKKTAIGGVLRRFNPKWFDKYGDWLEYSVEKDKAFCLCCYLFRDQAQNQGGSDCFVSTGFCGWNKGLDQHVGSDVNSFHNNAKRKCEYLMRQGLPFRGHDESDESVNRGNFLELLKYTAGQNESVRKVVLNNAPKNNQMTSPPIQKDIVHCFSEEVTKSIIEEMDNDVFGLLVDESADVSDKEQMAVVFRFVDKYGLVKERFVGIIHVKETSSISLKYAIDSLFAKYGLSLKQVRGQGYDGASNMKGEFNGLRSLILKEIGKKHFEVGEFFDMISFLMNVVGASCKRKDLIRENYRKIVEEGISNGEIKTGTGLNQEISLQRPGNTRWGSHYKTLLRLVELFSFVVKVLEYIQDEGTDSTKRQQAYGILKYFHTFDFVFYLHLMLFVLGLTDSLSKALQRKDQDILNAISLVESTKSQLQKLRDDGWGTFMAEVSSFCEKNDIGFVIVEEEFVDSRRPRKKTGITTLHHYKVDCFYNVLDMQLQEFNDRFDEVNSELLVCMSSLSPIDSFRQFDKSLLMRLAEFYPDDFSPMERKSLDLQLEIYLDNVKRDERFVDLKSLGDLARVMVETRKHLSHPLVYRLLKLSLIVPVATATVERCFSAMTFVKTTLRTKHYYKRISDKTIPRHE